MSLNERQKAFCEYYAACFNATEAAIKAGYSKKTAYSIGQRLLKNVETQKYLQTLTETVKTSRIATIDEVLTYLSNTMRNADELTRERTKAAQLLSDILNTSDPTADNNALKIVVERKVVNLRKNDNGTDQL